MASHNNVTVAKRISRQVLVSLYEQSSQVCQVAVKVFLKKDGPPEEDAEKALGAAEDFMIGIAELYCADKVPRGELLAERGSRLALTQPPKAAWTQTKSVRFKVAVFETYLKKTQRFITNGFAFQLLCIFCFLVFPNFWFESIFLVFP